MLRSLIVGLLAIALCGSSARAANRFQNTYKATKPGSNARALNTFMQKQIAYKAQKRMEDLRRAQMNRNDEAARRTLGANHGDRAQAMASPFVRPNRVNAGWDARGLGMMTHASTVAPQRSIYNRLGIAPSSIRAQLAAQPPKMGFITGLLFRRAKPLPMGNKAIFANLVPNTGRAPHQLVAYADLNNTLTSHVRSEALRTQSEHAQLAGRAVFASLKN